MRLTGARENTDNRKMKRMDSKAFFKLLSGRSRADAAAAERVAGSHLCELTVMMCDASGFSRRLHEYGVLPFFTAMARCHERILPMIARSGGDCIAHDADNILAVFPDCRDAVRAAASIQRWLRSRNARLPDPERFHLCIGIHRGEVVRLKDRILGPAVNIAAKLGEDLAGKDEVLLTRQTLERLPPGVRTAYLRSTEIGGKTFELHTLAF